MRATLPLLLLLLLSQTGCHALLARRSAAMEWAHHTHATTTTYPTTATYTQPLSLNTTLTLTLTITDPHNATLDCGNNLRLRIATPDYTTGKAHFTFEDADNDGTADLHFIAPLHNTPTPLHVIFLHRPTTWEHYLLPF